MGRPNQIKPLRSKELLILFLLFLFLGLNLLPSQISAQENVSVTPSSIKLDVPFGNQASVTLYVTSHNLSQTVYVRLSNLPLTVEPTTFVITKGDVNKPVQLIFHSDVLLEAKTYTGEITIYYQDWIGNNEEQIVVYKASVDITLLGPTQIQLGEVMLTNKPEVEYSVAPGEVFNLKYVVEFKPQDSKETCIAGISIAYPNSAIYEGYTANLNGEPVTFNLEISSQMDKFLARLGPNNVSPGNLTMVLSLMSKQETGDSYPLQTSYAFFTRNSEEEIVDAQAGNYEINIKVPESPSTPEEQENDFVPQVAGMMAGGVVIVLIALIASKERS